VNRSKISHIWLYVLLAQILPISFIQNLFEIARFLPQTTQEEKPEIGSSLLEKADKLSQEVNSKTSGAEPQKFHYHANLELIFYLIEMLMIVAYSLVIAMIPVFLHRSSIVLVILATRALLIAPYAISTIERKTPPRSGLIWTAAFWILIVEFLYSFASNLAKGKYEYPWFSHPHDRFFSIQNFMGCFKALNSNHAVAALGWDVLIALLSGILTRSWSDIG
jgi:hypothetical protein